MMSPRVRRVPRPHLSLVDRGDDAGQEDADGGAAGQEVLSARRRMPKREECTCPYHRMATGERINIGTVQTSLFAHGRDCVRQLLAESAAAQAAGDYLRVGELAGRMLTINALFMQESAAWLHRHRGRSRKAD